MSSVAVGLALAAGATYAVGSVMEHHVARQQAPDLTMRPGLVLALLRRPLWVFAFVVGIAGYGLEASALALGNVIAVAPLLVSGLLFALPLSAWRSHRAMTRGDWIAAVVLTAALAVFVAVGSPQGDRSDAAAVGWIVAIVVTAAIVGALVVAAAGAGVAGHPERRALLLGTGTGVLYGLTAVLTKTTTELLRHDVIGTLGHWQPYALGAASLVALLLNQSAFQAGHLASSLPAISVVNPVAASVLGAVLFGEHLGTTNPLTVAVVALSGVAMVWTTLALARSTALDEEDRSDLIAG